MVETVLEKELCDACGADVRDEALFCYNCGGPVTVQQDETVRDLFEKNDDREADEGDKTSFESRDEGAEADQDGEPDAEIDNDRPIPDPFVNGPTAVGSNGDSGLVKAKTAKSEKPTLESAANLRNRVRDFKPQRIEIIWEQHENVPNFWFIGGTIAISILFALILLAALYMK